MPIRGSFVNLRYAAHAEVQNEQGAKEVDLAAKYQQDVTDGVDEVYVCRRRRNKLEAELGESIAKYDAGMSELQAQIKELRATYDVEKKEFEELREYFDMVDRDQEIADAEEEELRP